MSIEEDDMAGAFAPSTEKTYFDESCHTFQPIIFDFQRRIIGGGHDCSDPRRRMPNPMTRTISPDMLIPVEVAMDVLLQRSCRDQPMSVDQGNLRVKRLGISR